MTAYISGLCGGMLIGLPAAVPFSGILVGISVPQFPV
ncbi:hypothetical protein GGE07_004239 [Sinorhizobium terangae]|nr:hypothetical protein [Sinorhizobium terangae]